MLFHNSYSYLKKVDQLPTGPEWHCKVVTAQGNIIEENRSCIVEELELWFREPVECARELLSNPAFEDYISYTPEHVLLRFVNHDLFLALNLFSYHLIQLTHYAYSSCSTFKFGSMTHFAQSLLIHLPRLLIPNMTHSISINTLDIELVTLASL